MTWLTEDMLAQAFEELISSADAITDLPRFNSFAKEMTCRQGRPDFVASTSSLREIAVSSSPQIGAALSNIAAARILAIASYEQEVSGQQLLQLSGYSAPHFRTALNRLIEANLLTGSSSDLYMPSQTASSLRIEFWAFEIKLVDWKRALFQALQYRAFAQRAVIVITDIGARRAQRNIETFQSLGIGISVLDMDNHALSTILPPAKAPPSSLYHYYHALGHFISSQSRHNVGAQ